MARRFRVALTFNGKRRAYVKNVAAALASRLDRSLILFDDFHRAEWARSDLGAILPQLYLEESDLVVAILDDDYREGDWCGLEWNAVLGLLKRKQSAAVMLTRFAKAEPVELCGMAGYLDLEDLTALQFTELILERLAINDSHMEGKRHAQENQASLASVTIWPSVDIRAHWRVADHFPALEAFESLLSDEPEFRMLMVTGRSGTGKSLVTRALFRAAARMHDVFPSGRLDFKGGAQLDAEITAFASDLGVSIPSMKVGLSGQLPQILLEIKSRRKIPTLLIFDTFEMAGEAGEWLAKNMVRILERCTLLRIVVAGQTLPDIDQIDSAGIVGPILELEPPTPHDWLQYGKSSAKKAKDLNLRNVKLMHKLANGQPAILSHLLGPSR